MFWSNAAWLEIEAPRNLIYEVDFTSTTPDVRIFFTCTSRRRYVGARACVKMRTRSSCLRGAIIYWANAVKLVCSYCFYETEKVCFFALWLYFLQPLIAFAFYFLPVFFVLFFICIMFLLFIMFATRQRVRSVRQSQKIDEETTTCMIYRKRMKGA